MIVQVVFEDGTILEEAILDSHVGTLFEIGLAFKDEPGFNNVRVLETQEAGAVPKMRHYITRGG